MLSLQCPVVGANFRPAEARETLKACADKEFLANVEITLEGESDNPYDSNAVKVIIDGDHVGYVPKDQNEELAGALADGREFEVQIDGWLGSLKPLITITEVPAEALEEAEDNADDFD